MVGAGFIDFIVDPSMQVLGDMLERIVQSSAQQSQSGSTSDTAAAAGTSAPADNTTSPPPPPTILPGTNYRQFILAHRAANNCAPADGNLTGGILMVQPAGKCFYSGAGVGFVAISATPGGRMDTLTTCGFDFQYVVTY